MMATTSTGDRHTPLRLHRTLTAAILGLALIGVPGVLLAFDYPELIDDLTDDDPSTRAGAAIRLAHLGASDAVVPISTMLRTESDPVASRAAARALVHLGDPRGVGALLYRRDLLDSRLELLAPMLADTNGYRVLVEVIESGEEVDAHLVQAAVDASSAAQPDLVRRLVATLPGFVSGGVSDGAESSDALRLRAVAAEGFARLASSDEARRHADVLLRTALGGEALAGAVLRIHASAIAGALAAGATPAPPSPLSPPPMVVPELGTTPVTEPAAGEEPPAAAPIVFGRAPAARLDAAADADLLASALNRSVGFETDSWGTSCALLAEGAGAHPGGIDRWRRTVEEYRRSTGTGPALGHPATFSSAQEVLAPLFGVAAIDQETALRRFLVGLMMIDLYGANAAVPLIAGVLNPRTRPVCHELLVLLGGAAVEVLAPLAPRMSDEQRRVLAELRVRAVLAQLRQAGPTGTGR